MLTADRRRKEPRELTRPGAAVEPAMGLTGTPETGMVARGLAGFLAHAEMTGAVKRSG